MVDLVNYFPFRGAPYTVAEHEGIAVRGQVYMGDPIGLVEMHL